ncbi:AraC family transcriptional regulator [Vibrio sp. FNV 38]|nr:AraC family transcriptional regulator [Vibrio sp. FNV 38]
MSKPFTPQQTLLPLEPAPAEVVTLPSFMNCHDHSYTQVVIGLNGKSEFEVAGIGNIVGPGQGCIVHSGEGHAFGSLLNPSDILVLNLPNSEDQDPLMLQKLNQLAKTELYFQLDRSVQQIIQLMTREMRDHPDDVLLRRACNDTVISLLHRHTEQFQVVDKSTRFDIELLNRYIDQHLGRKISVAQLAGSVFLSESQFHHLFKTQFKLTPHQYVLSRRVDKAKRLIEQGQFTVGQVAEIAGFSSQSAFAHAFSRLVGQTPSAYRKYGKK